MLENYVNNIKLKLMEVESDEKIACTRRHKNRLAPSTEHPHPKPHTLPPGRSEVYIPSPPSHPTGEAW